MNYPVYLLKTIVAGLTALIFAVLAVIFFLMRFWIVGGIFVALLAVYLVIAIKNCYVIHIGEDRVYRIFPGRGISLNWSDIQDVGVVGIKVLGRAGRKYTGGKYIYFSDRKLSEDELFNICLKWPPDNMLFLHFSHKRIAYIQTRWENEITMYNTGNLSF